MPRTTVAAVQAILSDNWDCHTDLQQFIDTATVVVDRVVATASLEPKFIIITNAEAELMERWLAGHYYHVMDQMYQTKNTAEASANFQGQTTMSIEGSKYGQVAINMDFSGCLSAISRRQFARGFWMGTSQGSGAVWCAWRGGWWW